MDHLRQQHRHHDPAPNFNRADSYPSAGTMIGPAWQAMWDCMVGGAWTPLADMVASAQRAAGVSRATATNLASGARRAGHVEVEYRTVDGARRAFYRRTK